jgi:N,N-dimethylformamidase beta subunit-like protein
VRAVLLAAIVVLLCGALPPAVAQPQPNATQAENARAGTTAWQRTQYGGVELYADQIGALPGDAVGVHVTADYRYQLRVYRLGWYGGAGARLMTCVPSCTGDEPPTVQRHSPAAGDSPQRAGWSTTDVVQTEADWPSGYYVIEAELTSGSVAGRIGTTYMIVRQPADQQPSQVLVQVPVNTWEAYNAWGGHSLYNLSPLGAAIRVSFDRPFDHQANSPLWWEIQTARFLEREGYDVSYQTDVDTDADPTSLLRHRLVIVNGHDEYWTSKMRDGFDAALAGGTNLAFMSSNDAYWNIRYEDDGHTILTYKSLYDPNPDVTQKTAMFREIGRPECLLEGLEHFGIIRPTTRALDYTVTAAGASDPWLAGTGLHAGDTIAGVVGREHDTVSDYPGCQHPGEVTLFHYDGSEDGVPGDATRYTAPSGARVFASGAQEFSWALDGYRADDTTAPAAPIGADRTAPVDPHVQQFMRNALDDLTRPQPPLRAVRVKRHGVWHVRTGWSADPRIVGRFVFRLRDDGQQVLVCSGHSRCLPPAVTQPGTYRYMVEYVDAWGQVSSPVYTSSWTRP